MTADVLSTRAPTRATLEHLLRRVDRPILDTVEHLGRPPGAAAAASIPVTRTEFRPPASPVFLGPHVYPAVRDRTSPLVALVVSLVVGVVISGGRQRATMLVEQLVARSVQRVRRTGPAMAPARAS